MTECPAAGGSNDESHASLLIVHRAALGAALTLLPVALWCMTHRYSGLIGDSELYAMQALARIDSSLARDVFLSAASQDRYTVFSPVYSLFIRILGLPTAALSLLVALKVCFYVAAWAVVRKLSDSGTAFLSVALLVAAPTEYGAYHVFSVSEDMLTARTAAEALAMMGLSLYLHGRSRAALAVAGLGLSFHALMALPMVLLLLSLRVGIRASVGFALAIIAGVLGAASISVWAPERVPGFLSVMDPNWLDMVRERSQFVFVQLWRLQDWATNARPILSLSISILVLQETRVRTVCTAALLVGAVGFAIGFIAGVLGPVSIFLQGQAWRWIWVPETIGLLLLAPTLLQMMRGGAIRPRLCRVAVWRLDLLRPRRLLLDSRYFGSLGLAQAFHCKGNPLPQVHRDGDRPFYSESARSEMAGRRCGNRRRPAQRRTRVCCLRAPFWGWRGGLWLSRSSQASGSCEADPSPCAGQSRSRLAQ